MKHIVVDARNLGTSTGRYDYQLLHYLQKIDHGHRYTVLAPTLKPAWQPTNKNFEVLIVDIKNYTFAKQLRLPSILRKLKPDLTHFLFQVRPVFYNGLSILTVHDLNLMRVKNYDMPKPVFEAKQLVYRRTVGKMISASDQIITSTNWGRDDIRQTLHYSGPISVIPLAADPINADTEPVSALKGKQFIMYVGQSSPYKNQRGLIIAHQQMIERKPNLHLAIAGKQDLFTKQNKTWTKQNGFKNIHWLGFVTEGQLRWLYENTAAYVFPSFTEGFGLPGLEAMCFDAPVVSSNSTCLPEVYGDAAEYFEPSDPGDIARAIESVINDEKLRNRLIVSGRQQLKKYSWQKTAEQTLALYGQLLGEL